jgi:hypothetical protein
VTARASKAPPEVCDPSKRPLPASAIGKRVRVHMNLHNGCYVVSIRRPAGRGRRPGDRWQVAGYTKGLRLSDVTAQVSEAGFESCRREQVRNVHAWIDGILREVREDAPPPEGWRRLRYNCRTQAFACFYQDTGDCFVSATAAVGLSRGRFWVSPIAADARDDYEDLRTAMVAA